MKVQEVFTPGSFPTHTYVERDHLKLEQELRDALDTPGYIASVSGPSKSGKTVLVERVVGRDNLIVVTGAGITHFEQVWGRALDWLHKPDSKTRTVGFSGGVTPSVSAKASAGIPAIGKVDGSAAISITGSAQEDLSTTFSRAGMQQVAEEIAGTGRVLLIDDFHYLPRDTQNFVAESMKEGARRGIRICTASVPHRAEDVVRANPDLTGRLLSVDLDYWNSGDLVRIAELGFEAMGFWIDEDSVARLVVESAGSPQLMQALCLNTCLHLGIREAVPSGDEGVLLDETDLEAIFRRTARMADRRGLVSVLKAGPDQRGKERKEFPLKNGEAEDTYQIVVRALAMNPPLVRLRYSEIRDRIEALCVDEKPGTTQIKNTCRHMAAKAQEYVDSKISIDWDEHHGLDVADPYLLFYLRWGTQG